MEHRVTAEIPRNAVDDDVLGVDDAVGVFQIPAGGTHLFGGGPHVGAGQIGDGRDHGPAVLAPGHVAAVDHDVAVARQMLADGPPAGRIVRHRPRVDNGVVEQKIPGVAVAHHVNGAVLHPVLTVKIFVDLVEGIFAPLQDQHVGVLGQLGNDLVLILHVITQDHQLAGLGNGVVLRGKGVGEGNGVIAVVGGGVRGSGVIGGIAVERGRVGIVGSVGS